MQHGARQQLFAHGLSTITTLPVPTRWVVLGAAVVLVVSFVVLAFAWRRPRFTDPDAGAAVPLLRRVVDSPATRAIVVCVALLVTAWVTVAAVFGPNVLINPAFGMVYAVLWVGLVPAALIFGTVYRLCNPLRWVHRGICRLARIDPERGAFEYPQGLGMWPAAVGLMVFTWLELANPDYSTDLAVVRGVFLALAIVPLMWAMLFGSEAFAKVDPFEVYSTLVARLSPFGRTTAGRIVVRNPLANLERTPAVPGLVGVVAVLFGSTIFDSFHSTVHYFSIARRAQSHLTTLNTVGLVLFCAAVLLTFGIAAVLTGTVGGVERQRMPRLLAHSVIPIVVGYIVAHYFTFFISEGIQTLQQLGDPLVRGWNLTGFADNLNAFSIYYHTDAIWGVQVGAVVVGHVLGVVAAHNRAVSLLPARKAITGQLPMLVLMIGYTMTGLWLLFSS
jgi:hypothetical protein